MKKRPLIYYLIILLFLVAVFFRIYRSSFSTLSHKDNDFAFPDTATITKIFLADKINHSVTLTRKSSSQWIVDEQYPVRSDAINTLLCTINMLAVKNVINHASWNSVIKNLAAKAIKVEIYEGDKRVKLYYVGQETADELGTYMLLANPRTGENYSQPYIIYIPGFDGFLYPRYITEKDKWRDRTIFQSFPYQIHSLTIRYPESDSSFRITIEGRGRFILDNPVTHTRINNFDTMAVEQYLTYYQYVNWEILWTPENKDSILNSPPIAIINLQDTTGKIQTVRLYHKKTPENDENKYGIAYRYDPDRLYALVNETDWAMVQYYVFGKMLQPVTYFTRRLSVEKK